MTDTAALQGILGTAIGLAFYIAIPVVAAALASGLAAGLLQAFTRLEEQTIGFVARLLAVSAALAVLGGWMSDRIIQFTVSIWNNL